VDVNGLRLAYWPASKDERREGSSLWWLGRVGGGNVDLPSDKWLEKAFSGASVLRRTANHCIVYLPTNTTETIRGKFLTLIANHISA